MPKKLTYEYVKDFFEKEGCELLETEYINSSIKMKYVATCGHFHKIEFVFFRAGNGRLCSKCGRKIGALKHKLSYEYIKEYFKKEGCALLEDKYIDSKTKMKYLTQCGHVNFIRFNEFKSTMQGRLCPKCSKKEESNKRKYSYKHIKDFFKKEGCEFFEKEYTNNHTKMKYMAQCGHINFISYTTFKNGHGRVCPKCAVLTGEKNPNWNSNLTDEDRIKERSLLKNKMWRKAVFERDNYTCHMTGLKGKIVAHHLKPYYKYKDLRFKISNGITLNEEFHKFCHHVFGYKAEIGPSELVECHYLWDNGKGVKYK